MKGSVSSHVKPSNSDSKFDFKFILSHGTQAVPALGSDAQSQPMTQDVLVGRLPPSNWYIVFFVCFVVGPYLILFSSVLTVDPIDLLLSSIVSS